ncbi:MAG: hydroxymethylbilane synthase [Glaciecola sp.]|jgi:hydroxymethylbilane synthase
MSAKQTITIGTRGSDLALWQAHFVKGQLEELGCEVVIDIIKTRGDEIQHLSFEKMEGKGFFTKEIEEALLSNKVDLAIHSFKDLETAEVPGLEIAAVSYRENPTDTLIIKKDAVDESQYLSLKSGAKVGTSSARRKAQLLGFRKDIELVDLRGNVPTRIDKLRDGNYDAIMLATAGLNRLKIDLSDFHIEQLNPKEFIPAPAQGVLGLQIRIGDKNTNYIVSKLNDADVRERIKVERGVLKIFSGGCQLPLGVYCEKEDDEYHVWGALGQDNGIVNRAHFVTKNRDTASLTMVEALKKKILI